MMMIRIATIMMFHWCVISNGMIMVTIKARRGKHNASEGVPQ